ncbi:hypothetical protein EBU95_20385, partial [bacterium]|nr:hypothetical protein [bacterium]
IHKLASEQLLAGSISDVSGYISDLPAGFASANTNDSTLFVTKVNKIWTGQNGTTLLNDGLTQSDYDRAVADGVPAPSSVVSNLPFINKTLGSDNDSNYLPTTLSQKAWYSLFADSEQILPEYKFKISIEDSGSPAYALVEDMSITSEQTIIQTGSVYDGLFSLDSSNLQDNDVYMEEFLQPNFVNYYGF